MKSNLAYARVFVFLVFMACLDVKKMRESKVEGGRVIQLSCLKVF